MRNALTASLMLLSLGATTQAQEATSAAAPATTAPAAAAAKPVADSVKQVWEFYYKGKGQGVVLADAKLCTEVGKTGDDKSECTKEVPAEGVKAGASVSVWQAYLVPTGDTVDDITLQLKQGDTVRETKDVKIKGESWRVRTWNTVRIPKPGTWTIVLTRGSETLKSFTVNATK